jgi:nucleotide-binding universal stress UspA family protein
MREIKRILFATDFSEGSDFAFDYAKTLAEKCGARLLLVHVISEPVDLRGFYVPHISFDSLEEEIRESAEKMMGSFCKENLKDFDDYETLVTPGIPYETIIEQAQVNSVDMIIMGTHGRSGLDHVLFGSTAEKVVRKSPLPVMTIKVGE